MSDILNKDKSNKDEKKTYSYSDRKKLSAKIMNIKKKEDYIKVFKIVNQDPNNKFTENSNGIWLDFKSLSDETISKVEKFIIRLKNKSDEDSTNSLEYVPYSTDENFSNIKKI